MITLRKSHDRGHADHGWLESFHTFSFADYHDSKWMGFRDLRVINEDRVQPGQGFGPHSHRDMEIVTYVLEGSLAHRDSLGNGSILRPGDVQRMSAGTGVTHSEFNASQTELVHFLQIWIVPETAGIEPSYEEKRFEPEDRAGKLCLVGSRHGRDGSVRIHQDVDLYATLFGPGQAAELSLRPGRHAWVQVANGGVQLNGTIALSVGDGAALSGESRVSLSADRESEVLVFDLR